MTRNEILISVGLTLLIGGLALWAVIDTGRRSRDTEVISAIRQLQADLDDYRRVHASYPASLDNLESDPGIALTYEPGPKDCGPSKAEICGSYQIHFRLEGRVGNLTGGACLLTAGNLTCQK
jgi:type II secretory pathway pseudopilin PulG